MLYMHTFLDDNECNWYENKNAIKLKGPRLLRNVHSKCAIYENYIFRDFMVSLPIKGDTAYFITWSPSSASTAGFLTHPSRFM